MDFFYCNFIFMFLICNVVTNNVVPEINDQFQNTEFNMTTEVPEPTLSPETTTIPSQRSYRRNDISLSEPPSAIAKLYVVISTPVTNFISNPRVKSVLKNIGTCMVNGVMDLVSYYVPAPFVPLLASAAGMIIPFEPVVMLKQKMPVTSYRRAFRTAVDGFLGTFDKYKLDGDDPYMIQRFNRRLMGSSSEKNTPANQWLNKMGLI